MQNLQHQTLSFGDFTLDLTRGCLLRSGEEVKLRPQSFEVLKYLVENSGRLVRKEELFKAVWPDTPAVTDGVLVQCVIDVRRALGDDGKRMVKTKPRRGYIFEAEVTRHEPAGRAVVYTEEVEGVRVASEEGGLAGEKTEPAKSPAPPAPRSGLRGLSRAVKLALVCAAAVVLAAITLVLYRHYTDPGGSWPAPIRSVAVLPLENLSGDPAQDYFADGMTEALIANLAKIGALRVISRTSVMQYKGVGKSLPEIARELNVDAVIEGSVQRSGERVRITVQLIHTPTERNLTERNLWAESYERSLRDVLALQSEVAQAITGEIKVKLTPQERLHLAKARQTNPEAYDSYLRGKFYFNLYTEKDSERAIENLERAVATDPGFAEAHAALALAYQYQFVGFKPEEKQLQEKSFVEVEKALALDPDLADAYIVRGRTLWSHANHFQHEEAIRQYRRALSLNPNSDEAFFQIGLIYNHIGLFDKAHQEFQKAIAINPNNVRARWFTGQTILYQGKYREFLAISRHLPRKTNPHLAGYQIAWALFQLGRKDEALATLEEFLRDFPEDTPGTLASMQAVIFAATGERSQAEEKIKLAVEKERDSVQFHHTAYNIGAAYALMNKPEQAIEWLQSAAEDGFPCYPVFETDPHLNNIRPDPRFVAFIAKLKEQWERYQTTL